MLKFKFYLTSKSVLGIWSIDVLMHMEVQQTWLESKEDLFIEILPSLYCFVEKARCSTVVGHFTIYVSMHCVCAHTHTYESMSTFYSFSYEKYGYSPFRRSELPLWLALANSMQLNWLCKSSESRGQRLCIFSSCLVAILRPPYKEARLGSSGMRDNRETKSSCTASTNCQKRSEVTVDFSAPFELLKTAVYEWSPKTSAHIAKVQSHDQRRGLLFQATNFWVLHTTVVGHWWTQIYKWTCMDVSAHVCMCTHTPNVCF